MSSVVAVSANPMDRYKNVINYKPKQGTVVSSNSQSTDTFEKQEDDSFFKKAKEYLLSPIPNPNYNRDAFGQKPTTNRLKKYGGYAFTAATYAFLLLFLYRMLKSTGVNLKPEKASSFMSGYKEDLSRAPRLQDLALPDVLKGTVERLMNKIKNPESFIQKGGTNKNTILLYGPPGTGKTTVAKAIAKEIDNAELFSVDLSTIQGPFVGESEAKLDKVIRSICQYAKENPQKKAVVLMDEFDSIAIKDNGSSNQQYHASLLNVLKRAISERLTQHDNIILIATTNAELNKAGNGEFVQKLDAAIADRFGEQIRVDNPTKDQFVKAILHHYKDLNMVDDVLKQEGSREIDKIAQQLSDNQCSFRTLENIFNAAAAASKKEKLTVDDILSVLGECIESTKKETGSKMRIGFV